MFAGCRIQQAAIDLHLDVAGQKFGEQLFLTGFVQVFAMRALCCFLVFSGFRRAQRQKAQAAGRLMRHGDEFPIDHPDLIQRQRLVAVDHLQRHGAGKGKVHAAHAVAVGEGDLLPGAADGVASFASHTGELHVHALRPFFGGQLESGIDDVGIEAAAQAAIRSHEDNGAALFLLMLGEQRMCAVFHLARQFRQHLTVLARIGTEALDASLRAAQLRRGHHVHGLGDLLGLADPHDLHFDVFE